MEPDGRMFNSKNIGKQSTIMVGPYPKNARTQVARRNTGMGATREKAKKKTSSTIENMFRACDGRWRIQNR